MANRLRYLDALRGMAVLSMMPLHLFLSGVLGSDVLTSGLGGITVNNPLAIFQRPLGTGLILFFFVTGISLTTFSRTKTNPDSSNKMELRVLRIYGSYLILGSFVNFIYSFLFMSVTSPDITPVQILMNIFGENFFSLSQPIIGISLGAIIAFPLIFHFSWKKLAIVASAISLLEGLIVYFVPIPDFFILNLLFADPFCVVKGLSLIFYGAAITKLGLTDKNLKKSFIILGGVICAAYIFIPLILGFGMSHFLFAIWVYPHAMIFITGASIFLTGIFQYLDETKINITPFAVLGRTAFIVYYVHFILLLTSMLILMRIGIILSTTLIITELAVTASGVWILMYFYSKWRWGKPSNWYEK